MSWERSNFLAQGDYKADVSGVSSSPERIQILPCLKRPLAGSIALNVLKSIITLLKADVLSRARLIASNSEESLLITPAEMRKKEQQTKQENDL